MALTNLKQGFAGRALAAGLATAAVMSSVGAANADDARPLIAASADITVVEDSG